MSDFEKWDENYWPENRSILQLRQDAFLAGQAAAEKEIDRLKRYESEQCADLTQALAASEQRVKELELESDKWRSKWNAQVTKVRELERERDKWENRCERAAVDLLAAQRAIDELKAQAVSSEPVAEVLIGGYEVNVFQRLPEGQLLFTTPPNHREAMEKALKAMEETTPIFYAEAIAALKEALTK